MAKTRRRPRRNKKYSKTQMIAYLAFVLIVGVYYFFFMDKPQSAVNISGAEDTVAILNVGQADTSLISSGGQYCLIDAAQTEYCTDTAVQYLEEQGIKEIELLVLTHFHMDHTGDMMEVIDNFKINNILIPRLSQENTPTTAFFAKFLDRVEEKGIKLHTAKKGDRYPVGKGELIVADDTINTPNINNTSVATLFVQGDFSYLNTGDGERDYELQLAQAMTQRVTLFKAGHHGSRTSNTEELLTVIKPKMVAVSAGKDNRYGHPNDEVMERFEKLGIEAAVTFKEGTLVYSMDTKQRIKETK